MTRLREHDAVDSIHFGKATNAMLVQVCGCVGVWVWVWVFLCVCVCACVCVCVCVCVAK
jgi:hypothetical protein